MQLKYWHINYTDNHQNELLLNLNIIYKHKKINYTFSKNYNIFIFAFLILVYHMDENGKQRNFTQKHQTLIYKKCYLRVWVCFFFVVREQDHKTPQKKNVIVFGFSAQFEI